jgi:hypothetical protein
LVGLTVKLGRFFVMERAQAHVIDAAFFQLDVAAHHVDDVDAVEQVLDEGLRNHGGLQGYTATGG